MLIGLTGRMGSGKDAVAAHLVEHHDFTRFAFADILKELARDIGWDGAKDEKGRRLLQDLGHGVRQHLGDDSWVKALDRAIWRVCNPYTSRIAVSDVRYPNEVEWVRSYGGLLVRVDRPGVNRSGPEHAHPTEASIDRFQVDAVLTNDSTLGALYEKVETLLLVKVW